MRNRLIALLIAATPIAAFAAHHEKSGGHEGAGMEAHAGDRTAIAVIEPTAGSFVSGKVHFIEVEDGVRVKGRVTNLSPGKHGFHVHQYGDLRKPDGTSAGGHFNPTGAPHGGPDSDKRHVGDLGNITADKNGVAEFSFVDPMLSFDGEASILGRGLIIHAGEDDLTSQPTGAAGARVGMAVIGHANPDL